MPTLTPQKVLSMDIRQIRRLRHDDFYARQMTIEEFIHLLKLFSSYWQYHGEPRPEAPHALLTSGLHSNGFINTLEVLKETNLCEILALEALKRLYEKLGFELAHNINWVIGPAMAAIDFTHDLARWLNARHGVTEKDADGKPTIWKRHVIEAGERVLIATELMTTADGSVQQCKDGVAKNPKPVSFVNLVPVLVHRCPSLTTTDGTPTLPVFKFEIANYQPTSCPYCSAGSEAIKPKASQENWRRLTAV